MNRAIYNSQNVTDSIEVVDSDTIERCREIYQCNNMRDIVCATHSKNCFDGGCINESSDIFNSNFISQSTLIENSFGILYCGHLKDCQYLYCSANCEHSQFLVNCIDSNDSLFSFNQFGTRYTLFNQQVTELDIMRAREYMKDKIPDGFITMARNKVGKPEMKLDLAMLRDDDMFRYALTHLPYYDENVVEEMFRRIKV